VDGTARENVRAAAAAALAALSASLSALAAALAHTGHSDAGWALVGIAVSLFILCVPLIVTELWRLYR